MNQLQIHNKIDEFLKTGVGTASIKVAQELISRNVDSKRYFFFQASEIWLEWIWENNLLDELKKKALDVNTYSYRLPELEYLTRMAEKEPQLVTDVIVSIPISEDTFNPEVIDRFFWITGLLPAEQIKILLPKILDENWVKLMAPFNRSGYEYQKIVEKLNEVKDYDSLTLLSQIILTVRNKEEFKDSERLYSSDKLFYLHDVSATGIFDTIISKSNTKKEESLKVFLEILTEILDIGKNQDETIFAKTDPFYLLDVNIFTIELDSNRRSHHREDIQNFIASCKELISSAIEEVKDNEIEIRRIYTTHISILPDSLTCWRLKLYAVTLYPNIFKKEIEEALFRVFNVGEKHHELDGGAEYHEGLIAGFGSLDEQMQRDYISNTIKYYGASLEDKTREKYRKGDGLEILSYIQTYLTPDEVIKAEAVFGKIPEIGKMTPHPSMGPIISGSGYITHKTPFNPADCTIEELIIHLKTDASPEVLNKTYKDDDFFSPRGVEGLGDAIKEDFKIRKTEYLSNLNKFFDRDTIFSGYVYSILRQIEDTLRAKESFTDEQYIQIINFFDVIRKSGERKEFEKSKERSYFSDWITVHKVMADVLLSILGEIKDNDVFIENKIKILPIIKYLLSIKSSPDADDDKQEEGEPSHIALNSVRGQAFRAFIQFTYNEGNTSLSREVKELYEYVLDNDISSAVRFTVGQFLASFYFRDTEFIKGLLPKIFPKGESGKEKLYFATWEGYLASSLYKELFVEFEPYYEYAIRLDPKSYPERKYLKGLDEALAVHLALAFMHFDNFKIGDTLFELFWNTPNEIRHYEFVSFIGRTCLTRSQAGEEWFKENNVNKENLISFWSWIISTEIKIEPKAFSGFGFWINPDKEVIDEKIIIKNLPITMEKSDGDIDWEYGLTGRIKKFAEMDPENTLKIIKYFLLSGDSLNSHRRAPLFSVDNEIKDALKIIYDNKSFKEDVVNLINLLIEKGSSVFWGLKEIIK